MSHNGRRDNDKPIALQFREVCVAHSAAIRAALARQGENADWESEVRQELAAARAVLQHVDGVLDILRATVREAERDLRSQQAIAAAATEELREHQ